MTIRTRLALWYSGLITIIIIILCVTVISVTRISIQNSVDQLLAQTANDLIERISVVPVGEFDVPDTQVVFGYEEIFSAPGVSLQVWQTHQNGEAIAPVLLRASTTIRDHHQPLDPEALADADDRLFSTHPVLQATGRVLTVPFYSNDNSQQIGIVQVSTSLDPFEQANQVLLVITLIAATISIVVSLALSLWLSARVTQPINRIRQAASNIATAEDLSTRLSWDGSNDEIGQLAAMFNHMMERLEHLFSVQQRFVGDVSHELRTPLTSIIGNLEIMKRYGVDDDSLDAVYREAERMSRMVNDLLLLHRADYGELEVDFYPVDLDSVMLDVYNQAQMLAKNRTLQIKLNRLEPARVSGNTDRLKQLIYNLLSNAVKFTSDGGSVSLGVYIIGDEAIIEIADTGIGISKEDINRIFDRFFQADHSRVHRSEADGAGLGLSIVRWIVSIHNGKIDVTSDIGKGTTFRVRLPLLQDKPAAKTTSSSQPEKLTMPPAPQPIKK